MGKNAQEIHDPVGYAVIAEGGEVLTFSNRPEDIERMQASLGGRSVALVERASLEALAAVNEDQARLLSRIEARLTLAGVPGTDLMARLDKALSEIASLRARCAELQPAGDVPSVADPVSGAASGEISTEASRLRAAVKSMMQALDETDAAGDASPMRLFAARRRLVVVLQRERGHPLEQQLQAVLARLEPNGQTGRVPQCDIADARQTLQHADELLRFVL